MSQDTLLAADRFGVPTSTRLNMDVGSFLGAWVTQQCALWTAPKPCFNNQSFPSVRAVSMRACVGLPELQRCAAAMRWPTPPILRIPVQLSSLFEIYALRPELG